MSVWKYVAYNMVAPAASTIVGRRNLVRFARALTMYSRLDIPNQMETNGESMVQQTFLKSPPNEGNVVVFDVGANAGKWSKSFLNNANEASVVIHAFEPASITFETLRQGLSQFESRVVCVNQAMSNRVGTAELFIMGANWGVNSLLAPQKKPVEGMESVTLNTVDEYCRKNSITNIGLMKIDAEGHDFAVIEGAKEMIATNAIELVQFEYNQRWIDSHHFLKDAFDLLLPLGYKLGKVTPEGIEFYPAYHFELESFREGNYLACLPHWVSRFPQVRWWNAE